MTSVVGGSIASMMIKALTCEDPTSTPSGGLRKYAARLGAGAAFVITIALPASDPASSAEPDACAALPRVAWWGELSHQAVTRRVAQDHDGDWDAYLEKWTDQLETLRSAHANRQEVFIDGRGLRLRGAALTAYLDKVARRVDVTRCLARRHEDD